jgi:anti-sigma B factor antagonist
MTKNKTISNMRYNGNAVIVDLKGEIDMNCSMELRERLLEILKKKPKVTVINLADVGFMDSSGLAILIEAMQITNRQNGQLKLVGVNERVQSILEISRLDSIFSIYATEEEALPDAK